MSILLEIVEGAVVVARVKTAPQQQQRHLRSLNFGHFVNKMNQAGGLVLIKNHSKEN